MNHRNAALLLCLSMTSVLFACDEAADEGVESELEHVYFDSDEVAETLAADPDATFLVDLSPGTVVHFDQGDEPFAFESFSAKCPSMAAPIPMVDFLRIVDLDFTYRDVWNLRSELTPLDEEFRAQAEGTWGCRYVCDKDGTDCFWDC